MSDELPPHIIATLPPQPPNAISKDQLILGKYYVIFPKGDPTVKARGRFIGMSIRNQPRFDNFKLSNYNFNPLLDKEFTNLHYSYIPINASSSLASSATASATTGTAGGRRLRRNTRKNRRKSRKSRASRK